MITFSEAVGVWSPLVFWYVVVNMGITFVFTFVVIFGGVRDLCFLLRGLREAGVDETDDGRVEKGGE